MTNPIRPPGRALIMHFTHIDNFPSILSAGKLVADSAVRSRLITDVGAADIKASRRRRTVPCAPGGVVADYVPFYFAPRSPMMYRIACEHRDGRSDRYPGGDDPLIYLVSSVDKIAAAGATWVASDGNCAAHLTRFTPMIRDLDDLVDWPLMRERIWKDVPEDQDRVRRRMAEFLVHREVPLSLITGYAVRTEDRKTELEHALRTTGIIDRYVAVRPGWYYGYSRGEVRK
ncbi:DUF4433 domain-containing protein [Micromonospora sp. NPDC049523]|uniref:type II toxin-antitoxin system toxin DNA ADP-ribosyl transferase DarT n=1 Tax=Micromonospora sp. NPDC049523 TaxID=3155921 RepID=UPI00342EB0B9